MKLLSVLFAYTALVIFAGPTQAQTQTLEDEASNEGSWLEEVIVTAQRREQSAMDVPISVMVFDHEIISQNNMKGAADYLIMTPNVNFREDGRGGHNSINIAIRGISDLSGGERVQATQALGFYWDEFSVATVANGTANPPLYDIEAVEVLRGPQGTYFGRGAEGGAINIQTIKPNQEFYGQMDLGIGTNNTFEVSGVLNILSSRLVATAAISCRLFEANCAGHPTTRPSLIWASYITRARKAISRWWQPASIRHLVLIPVILMLMVA
jgi:iron complex outermembrane receptor protein